LVTGHTGFTGTWLTFLLERLNVPVVGLSLPPEPNSLFDRANRTGAIPEIFTDIRACNAIGGGDWTVDRLLPDLIRGFATGTTVEVRNPESTRP